LRYFSKTIFSLKEDSWLDAWRRNYENFEIFNGNE
jgi:hypothetical protein